MTSTHHLPEPTHRLRDTAGAAPAVRTGHD